VERGLSGQRGGMYNTNQSPHQTWRSNGHLAGMERIHFSASSGVQVVGSSQLRRIFGRDSANLPHHNGARALRFDLILSGIQLRL
jgi:hypothetical protein